MEGGQHVGTEGGETIHIPTLFCLPCPPSVCLHCLYNPAMSLSLARDDEGWRGVEALGSLFPHTRFLLLLLHPHIPALSLLLLLCRSHSSSGATMKGPDGRPCLTRTG